MAGKRHLVRLESCGFSPSKTVGGNTWGVLMIASPQRIGRFEVRRVLGQGAMGSVYEAADPLLERIVAIKTIRLNLSSDERRAFEARFFREAKSAGRLNHPNIVTVYDVGDSDGLAFIAMEYLTGQTLRELIDSGVVLPLDRIRDMVITLANALAYAHANGVVHRDIKPANIMIAPDHDLKIMDFGIAQLPAGSQTLHGMIVGSPKYMAPEQVSGGAVDGRSDVFSLGVVLYELLVGKVPFDSETLSSVMYKIVHEDVVPPSEANARIPAAFDEVVMRALAKLPNERFQTASDFARALQALELAQSAALAARANSLTDDASDPLEATVVLTPDDANHPAGWLPAPSNINRATTDMPVKRRLRPFAWVGFAACILAGIAYFGWFKAQKPARDSVAAIAANSASSPSTSAAAPASDAKSGADVSKAAASAPSNGSGNAEPVLVAVAVYPWGEVWVNGDKVGISPPLNELRLRPGRHVVEIRNEARPVHRETITIVAGDSAKGIRHRFQ
jgi:eukaryotic-like serine/threonine-protein kinase